MATSLVQVRVPRLCGGVSMLPERWNGQPTGCSPPMRGGVSLKLLTVPQRTSGKPGTAQLQVYQGLVVMLQDGVVLQPGGWADPIAPGGVIRTVPICPSVGLHLYNGISSYLHPNVPI